MSLTYQYRSALLSVLVLAGCHSGSGSGAVPDGSVDPGGEVLTFRLSAGTAAFVAAQDGDGTWVGLVEDRGVYSTSLTSDRYGIAYGCAGVPGVSILHRTVADGLGVERSCGAPSADRTIELDVTVHNVPYDQFAVVQAGNRSAVALRNETVTVVASAGPVEVFASLRSNSQNTKVVRSPVMELQSDHAITIDFATEGSEPESYPLELTIGEVGVDDRANVSTEVTTETGRFSLGTLSVDSANPATIYQALAVGMRKPGDLMRVGTSVVTLDDAGVIASRSTDAFLGMPRSLALEIPPALMVSAPVLLTTPYLRPVFSFSTTGSGLPRRDFVFGAATYRESESVGWDVFLSTSWVGDAETVRYELPDLSGVAGFSTAFVLFDDVPINWDVLRAERNDGPLDGRIRRSAARRGTVQPGVLAHGT